jgi:hypothetical protein
MDLFGKWKEKAEQLEHEVEALKKELSGLQSLFDRNKDTADVKTRQVEAIKKELAVLQSFFYRNRTIADGEEHVKKIVAEAEIARSEAQRIKRSAELVASDIEHKSLAKLARLDEIIEEQEATMEKNLQTLGVLGIRAMLVEDLDIDPKLALKEAEQEIRRIEQERASFGKVEPIDVNYEFLFNGSKGEGRKFANQIKRLAKLAFDGQCRRITKTITANNGDKAEGKIRDAAFKINAFTEMVELRITVPYIHVKIADANCAWAIKKRDAHRKAVERDEREILRKERQLERENKQLIRDAEKAAKDEGQAEKFLDQAKEKLQQAHGDEIAKIQDQVARLQEALQSAQDRNDRAKSMAQITKAGHVYVISNKGSFGEGIYKIGMTRRLDPEDRVRELGDASVPFKFDTHAMIWSEDAPSLEAKLHSIFAKRRVNFINRRREFFKVSLDEVTQELKAVGVDADIRSAVAQDEYLESKRLWLQIQGDQDVQNFAEGITT